MTYAEYPEKEFMVVRLFLQYGFKLNILHITNLRIMVLFYQVRKSNYNETYNENIKQNYQKTRKITKEIYISHSMGIDYFNKYINESFLMILLMKNY